MDQLIENIYDVLFHPQQAMYRIAQAPVIWQGGLIFIISQLIPLSGLLLVGAGKVKSVILVMILVGYLLFSSILWYIFSALYYFFGELVGGCGSAKGVLCTLAYSSIPYIFIVPIFLVTAFVPSILQLFISLAAALGIFIWTIILAVKALRASLKLNTGSAVCVLVSPFVISVLTAVFFSVSAALLVNIGDFNWR